MAMSASEQGSATEGPSGQTDGAHRAEAICDELVAAGITLLAWVPDSETHFMHDVIEARDEIRVVQVCREGEALALCAGAYAGGARAALLIENQGLFDAGNILKWTIGMRLPYVMLVGYLFYETMQRDKTGAVLTVQGVRDVTEPFLTAFGVPTWIVARDEDTRLVGKACDAAFDERTPTAVLLSSADRYHPGT